MNDEQKARSQDATAAVLRRLIAEATEEVLRAHVAYYDGSSSLNLARWREARDRRELLEKAIALYVAAGDDPRDAVYIGAPGLLDCIRAALEAPPPPAAPPLPTREELADVERWLEAEVQRGPEFTMAYARFALTWLRATQQLDADDLRVLMTWAQRHAERIAERHPSPDGDTARAMRDRLRDLIARLPEAR